MSQIVDFGAGRWHELVAGVRMQPLFGDAVMLTCSSSSPERSSPSTATTTSSSGSSLTGCSCSGSTGVEHRLPAGHGYQIPGGVTHAAWAEGGLCRVLDVFHPVREDYRQRVSED